MRSIRALAERRLPVVDVKDVGSASRVPAADRSGVAKRTEAQVLIRVECVDVGSGVRDGAVDQKGFRPAGLGEGLSLGDRS